MARTKPAVLSDGFKSYLKSQGLNATAQRDRIITIMTAMGSHFDAEELAAQVRRTTGKASRATVYRTIAHLERGGMIRKVDLDHKHAHYELTALRTHHEHMVCRECGAVIEFGDSEMEEHLATAARKRGFTITDHRIQAFGYCSRCHSAEETR